MLELDELDDLHVVADRAEELRTCRVGDLGCEALPQRPVPEERVEGGAPELRQQLVLAAGHGEDDGCARTDGPVESGIGGRVARVEADDEIDALERVVAGDVPDFEAEALAAELPRERLALGHDVGLEVEPDDVDLEAVHDSSADGGAQT